MDALEFEKNQLLEQNKILKERIENERLRAENQAECMAKQKIKISRLEVKISKCLLHC